MSDADDKQQQVTSSRSNANSSIEKRASDQKAKRSSR